MLYNRFLCVHACFLCRPSCLPQSTFSSQPTKKSGFSTRKTIQEFLLFYKFLLKNRREPGLLIFRRKFSKRSEYCNSIGQNIIIFKLPRLLTNRILASSHKFSTCRLRCCCFCFVVLVLVFFVVSVYACLD